MHRAAAYHISGALNVWIRVRFAYTASFLHAVLLSGASARLLCICWLVVQLNCAAPRCRELGTRFLSPEHPDLAIVL